MAVDAVLHAALAVPLCAFPLTWEDAAPTGLTLTALGALPLIGLAVAGRPSAQSLRLIVTAAPQGLPHDRLELPPLTGLQLRQTVTIGRSLGCDLKLVEEQARPVHCRITRARLSDALAHLIVPEGSEVQLDGIVLPPGKTELHHMERLRIGEYEIQVRGTAPAVPAEVLCRDGRYVRGRPRNQGWETDRAIAVQPLIAGARAQTVPYGQIEQIRIYRTPEEDERRRHIPGADFVGGPLVLVRFKSGRTLAGRLERGEDAEQPRFSVYTKEHGALERILVLLAATDKVTVQPGTEQEPKARVATTSGRRRSRLDAPGPRAVSERDIEEQLGRAHEREPSEEAPGAAPRRRRPEPPPGDQRYIDKRGKPRI